MKTAPILALLAVTLIFTGCMRRYDITMRNGNVTTAKTKPKLNAQGYYEFTDVEGNPGKIYAGSVRQIAPHERSGTKDGKANYFMPSDK